MKKGNSVFREVHVANSFPESFWDSENRPNTASAKQPPVMPIQTCCDWRVSNLGGWAIPGRKEAATGLTTDNCCLNRHFISQGC
jgi:hypothetical protein